MLRYLRISGTLALLFTVMTNITRADVISIVGDVGDGQIDVNGVVPPPDLTREVVRVGAGGNIVRGHAVIWFFELPTLPGFATITGAELKFQYTGITEATIVTPPEFNVDLFGIDARPNALIQGSDYHDGDASLSSDFLIEESVLVPSSAVGSYLITNPNLLSFISSLYIGGTPSGAFVTFRLNPDVELPEFSGAIRGYEIGMADHSNPLFRPGLDLIYAVPEPSTIALLLIGWVGLVGYGWRRNRRQST